MKLSSPLKLLLCLFPLVGMSVRAQELVQIDSLGKGSKVNAYYYACKGPDCKTAALLTPTCAGLVDKEGIIRTGYARLAERMSNVNHVLFIDHFSTRGSFEDCPKQGSGKMTSESERLKDVLGGYLYLIQAKGADPASVVYVGFGSIMAVQ